MDGISYLVAVTQMKANNANEEAMQAADKHRDNAEKKKKLRAAQARLEALKKSLGGIKGDDAQAEKRVLEIDRQVTSIRKEIRSLAAASTPSPEKKRTRQTAESQR